MDTQDELKPSNSVKVVVNPQLPEGAAMLIGSQSAAVWIAGHGVVAFEWDGIRITRYGAEVVNLRRISKSDEQPQAD